MSKYKNLDLLNKHVSDGIVNVQKHDNFDYYIYNYSQTVQFQKLWDDVTIDSRGLILDGEGNIVARPFRKFFNLQEHDVNEIPFGMPFTVFEKMDGSLGITYKGEDGAVYIATRGSFQSEQAIKATQMLADNSDLYNFVLSLSDDYTLLFEIIYPENRIVVDYGGVEKLVFLGSYHKETGEFTSPHHYKSNFPFLDVPQVFDVSSIDELKNSGETNFEGYVVRFDNDFRVKVKLDEYVRLHRLMTNVSNVSVWESLKNGDDIETLLVNVPDEFYDWINEIINGLRHEFNTIESFAKSVYDRMNGLSRADIANQLLRGGSDKEKEVATIVFAIMDGKNYDDRIWKMIRPTYQKPFYQKERDDA